MACPKNPMFKRGTTCLLLGVLTAHRIMVDQVQALNAKGIEAAFMASASGERNNHHVVERLLGQELSVKKKNQKLDPERRARNDLS
jgi:hypothetical protein